MKKSKHLKIISLFLVLCLFCLAGTSQQKIKNVVQNAATNSAIQTKDTYFIKKDIVVDKPVSPLLYRSMIELGFGRSNNLWSELL